jgi:hypothetical protein
MVRRDVGSLEMLMTAAVTAYKLRRAYQLSRVHEVGLCRLNQVDP